MVPGSVFGLTLVGILLLFTSTMFWLAFWIRRRRHHLLAALEASIAWSVIGGLEALPFMPLKRVIGAELSLMVLTLVASVIAFAGVLVLIYEVGLLGQPPEPSYSTGAPWLWRNIRLVKGVLAVAIILANIMVFVGIVAFQSWPSLPSEWFSTEIGNWLFSGFMVVHFFLLMAGFVMVYCQAVQYARLCADEARRSD